MTPPIAIFGGVLVALALVGGWAVRQASRGVAVTRSLDRFQEETSAIAVAVAAATDPLLAGLDMLARSGPVDVVALAASMPSVMAALVAASESARRLAPPPGSASEHAAILHELDRATRAADLAAHGLTALTGLRRDTPADVEVDLKRASLNLRHARIAVQECAARVTKLAPRDLGARAPATGPRSGPGVATYVVAGSEDDDEPVSEPLL